ncbi:uncharacterized protein LOC143533809 [Bidens hawaiensis]|uniref:uncharacterized protein LOC143533809 n=1 Tax=Bidens hawaiensis TaxID=980011 RepID=UPI004049CDAE
MLYKSYYIQTHPSSKTMASKDSIITKEVEKHAENKIVAVATDDNTATEEDVVKDAKNKIVVVASDDNTATNEEVVEDVKNKIVVVASDDDVTSKEDVETEATTTKVVACDSSDRISEKEQKDEKEKEVDLGMSMDKLNLGPKKKLLLLPIGGFLVHRAHRRRPKTIPRKRQPDFSSGNFMSV